MRAAAAAFGSPPEKSSWKPPQRSMIKKAMPAIGARILIMLPITLTMSPTWAGWEVSSVSRATQPESRNASIVAIALLGILWRVDSWNGDTAGDNLYLEKYFD